MQNRIPTPRDQRPPLPDFDPVPRKHRHDGWTPERQRAFIEALAETGSVKRAARRINMSPEGAYYLRRQPGAEGFRRAWAAAIDFGVQNLADVAMDRALDGVPVPVFYKGEQVGERRRYNDRLLMFILRHRLPGQYGPLKALPTGTYHPQTRALLAADARAGGPAGEGADDAEPRSMHTPLRAELERRLDELHDRLRARYADDPKQREAWELIHGPVDWSAYEDEPRALPGPEG